MSGTGIENLFNREKPPRPFSGFSRFSRRGTTQATGFAGEGATSWFKSVGTPSLAVVAEVVDRGEIDGDPIEVGWLKLWQQAEKKYTDDDAVRDDKNGLAAVAKGDSCHDREYPAADVGERFTAFVGKLEVASGPLFLRLDVDVPTVLSRESAQGADFSFVKFRNDLHRKVTGLGNWLGGRDGPAHRRAIEGFWSLLLEHSGKLLGLVIAPLGKADVRFSAVEDIGGGSFGVADEKESSLLQSLAPGCEECER